jgi:hypothetical protein
MSSCGWEVLGVLRPGGRLVMEGAGLEAAVQDADEPSAELAHGGLVAGAPGALPVVNDAQQADVRRFRAALVKRGPKNVGRWSETATKTRPVRTAGGHQPESQFHRMKT